jgi:CTP:phosphocholine cytidylyltransferase-like protein
MFKGSSNVSLTRRGLARVHTVSSGIEINTMDIVVAGKPFINRQFDHLRRQRADGVVACVSYLGSRFRRFAGDGSATAVEVIFAGG